MLLLIQEVSVLSSPTKIEKGLVFFDKGATIGLIREMFAKKLKLVGRNVRKMVQVVGQSWSVSETKQYAVTLVDRSVKKHLLSVYSIDSITSPIQKVVLDGLLEYDPNM